jgi:hypothetical protein
LMKILEVLNQIGLHGVSKFKKFDFNNFTSECINFIVKYYSNLTSLSLTQTKQLPVCDISTANVEILDRIQIIFDYSE